MKNFSDEKTKLLLALTNEINQPQNKKKLQQLINKVHSLQGHADFDRSFALLVREAVGLPHPLLTTLHEFERYFQDKTNWIQSPYLRQLANHLLEKSIPMTFYGRSWTKQTADWMYFDTVLDIESLQKQFQMGQQIQIHENRDAHSGTERGLVDTQTGEGIIGRLD